MRCVIRLLCQIFHRLRDVDILHVITDIFDEKKSDFTPLTDSADQMYLSKAEQNTRVLIDEGGCKAASVTVMMIEGMGASLEYENFTLDRPFIFEIMSETGLPLFVGIVNHPV